MGGLDKISASARSAGLEKNYLCYQTPGCTCCWGGRSRGRFPTLVRRNYLCYHPPGCGLRVFAGRCSDCWVPITPGRIVALSATILRAAGGVIAVSGDTLPPSHDRRTVIALSSNILRSSGGYACCYGCHFHFRPSGEGGQLFCRHSPSLF